MTDNSNKIILDLCGGTGALSRPYKLAGYDVRLITLPEYDVRQVQFDDHGMEFIRQTYYRDTMSILYEDVYGILAAPPCTEFSLAKGGQPRDFEGAMRVVEACLQIIWHCRIYGKPKFWALENPVGFLRQFLGIPKYTFAQWKFGTEQVKRTDIWGYFREPTPTVKVRPASVTVGNRSHANAWRGSQKAPPEYAGLGLTVAAIRAITPQGFAEAFYRANR